MLSFLDNQAPENAQKINKKTLITPEKYDPSYPDLEKYDLPRFLLIKSKDYEGISSIS